MLMGIARVPNALSIEAATRFNTCDETPTVLLKPGRPTNFIFANDINARRCTAGANDFVLPNAKRISHRDRTGQHAYPSAPRSFGNGISTHSSRAAATESYPLKVP
jgi:hypothetical protein